MIRKKKMFDRPRKPFESIRIKEENRLAREYGLKNKKEIWRALAKINYFRKRAMALTRSPQEEQEVFLNKLRNIGLRTNSISDVLGLEVEDVLKRRLPSIVAKQKLANTVKHARQMVVHRKIKIRDRVMNSPSYLVPIADEDHITLKKKAHVASKPKIEEPKVEEPKIEAGVSVQ